MTQDVFVEAYFSLGGFAGRSPFGHWLARITTRIGYRFWKQADRRRQTIAIGSLNLAAAATPDDPAGAAELIQALLMRLKPPERMVLTLMYLEGLSVAEVADRTGWNRAVVKMRSMRARRRMQAIAVEAFGEKGLPWTI